MATPSRIRPLVISSPSGKSPTCSPSSNRKRPTATSTMPTARPLGSASGRRRMTKLEKRTTTMIGNRFLTMTRKSISIWSARYWCWSSLGIMMHCAAGGGRNKEQDAIELNDDHRRQRTEGDQAETVEHRVAAPDAGRETHSKGGQQRCGDGRCNDAAGIESETDELRRRKSGQGDDDQIAGDEIVADRVAQDDPPDADHDREADTEGRYHAQGQGRHAAAGNRLGLVSDGHQCRLGGDRREADAESEQHQPDERAAAGKIEGHRLAGRKDRCIESLDEQCEADENRGEAANQRRRIVPTRGSALPE
jgi:hypothetical protein